MTDSGKHRQDGQLAFVLHSYPYRETSLVAEVLSREHGRVALLARGARRPRSAMRGVLMGFQPLVLSWYGKHELRVLHKGEWLGGQPQLQGRALLCGLYLNELLLNLMARDDPHPELFDYYQDVLRKLADETDHAALLRGFERKMLQELGYALLLEHEAGSNRPVNASLVYRYIADRGPVPEMDGILEGLAVSGKTLLDMAADDYRDAVSVRQSKQLIRMVLNHHLSGKVLHTRELLRELNRV